MSTSETRSLACAFDLMTTALRRTTCSRPAATANSTAMSRAARRSRITRSPSHGAWGRGPVVRLGGVAAGRHGLVRAHDQVGDGPDTFDVDLDPVTGTQVTRW